MPESSQQTAAGVPQQFSRHEIFGRGSPELLHRGRSFTQPDIFVFNSNGQTYLLKDYAGRAWLIKALFTRRWLRREHEILACLANIPGIPQVFGLVDADAMVMEKINGPGPLQASRELSPEQYPPPAFFTDLHRLLARLHAERITHGDIRRANILISAEGRPVLIDFATAKAFPSSWWPPWSRWLWRAALTADIFSLAKIRASFYGELLTQEEKNILADTPAVMRFGRFLRKTVYRRFLKPKRWRERIARWRGSPG